MIHDAIRYSPQLKNICNTQYHHMELQEANFNTVPLLKYRKKHKECKSVVHMYRNVICELIMKSIYNLHSFSVTVIWTPDQHTHMSDVPKLCSQSTELNGELFMPKNYSFPSLEQNVSGLMSRWHQCLIKWVNTYSSAPNEKPLFSKNK